MQLANIFFIALALSVDAFVVSFSYGLIIRRHKLKNALKLATGTGLGQLLMPLAGWFATCSIHRFIEPVDHWIAFGVFLLLGLKIIIDAVKSDNKPQQHLQKKLTFKIVFLISVATSIDALVMGGTMYFMGINIWLAAPFIGLTTFICSLAGFHLNLLFKKIPLKWLEIGAGLILILLGCKVLHEHLSA